MLDRVPNDFVVNRVITVNDSVTHTHNPGQIGKRKLDVRLQLGGAIERFSKNLELTFHSRP